MIRVIRTGALLALAGAFIHCSSSMFSNPPEQQFRIGASTVGVQSVASHLNVPWQITWGPDQCIWYTEQSGTISKVNPETGKTKLLLTLRDVFRDRTSGLLGMTLHPDLKNNPYVFINYTGYSKTKTKVSKVVRYSYDAAKDTLVSPVVFLEYPAWTSHFGSRIVIAPDGKVMVATGDGAQDGNAQNIQSPNGKILRYSLDGSIPADNPFKGSAVWAWGLRNPQGLVYVKGKLYCSDHGDAIDDELNLLVKGGNYGWPVVEGAVNTDKEKAFAKDSAVVAPLRAWTPTIAPAGMTYYNSAKIPELKGRLLLTTLKGNSLRSLTLDPTGNKIVGDVNYFEKIFGRLRSVCVSPAGDVYLATSNRDWNPNAAPARNDDRIIRIYRIDAKHASPTAKPAIVAHKSNEAINKGALLYTNYCASCHKADGKGIDKIFPALLNSAVVKGDQRNLIRTVLNGKNQMPKFAFIENNDMAILLTYVRSKFAAGAGPLTVADIQSERK
ncbi:PQQ-dependent sugar dehydrogenase [Pedobacter africanus]|uniref:Glucose/arabinose dehydrogenase, beta-propeller fold n=1 Tax=Pedobacter africanus TaxID=151894 RepID=A0A1W2C0D1_9SPHI|nr:PQQ-dependent sugar dehydrogenase [Pedobacter africanus]SMC78178.1 Glucose/arabinose dehydrogenase, beta-propeller fold [Pedobacter africanus]